jgi:cell wall-associated NlpC family hydrolase
MDAAPAECPRLPWSVLAGIGKAGSDHGRSRRPGVRSGASPAGAEGPMQLAPAAFRHYAVDADPGRPLTPYDPADAIYTAAAMLCANGAPGKLRAAIYAYGHNTRYVTGVLRWAGRYAAPGRAAAVLSYALAQVGKPYRPEAGGSGLAMMAYLAAGISIPRSGQRQWAFGKRVAVSHARPGDLVFFGGSHGAAADPARVGIVCTATTMIVAPAVGQDVQIEPISQPGLAGFTDPFAAREQPRRQH